LAGNRNQLELLDHQYGGQVIRQRASDGYVNATAMCKTIGRNWFHYRELEGTNRFLKALESASGIPMSSLVLTRTGGDVTTQGTWVHPQIAIHLAQWLSADFAVQVTKWVFDWMSGLGSPAAARRSTPIFVQRFQANWDRVDPGYFSIISELFIRVYGRLEQLGHVLPDKGPDGKELRPDISVGKTFPKWLAAVYPGLSDKFKMYAHLLPNHIEVDARQYHNSVLPAYIEFIDSVWLPKWATAYFEERDPKALEYLPKMLPAPNND
jgi:hypothetical protein